MSVVSVGDRVEVPHWRSPRPLGRVVDVPPGSAFFFVRLDRGDLRAYTHEQFALGYVQRVADQLCIDGVLAVV